MFFPEIPQVFTPEELRDHRTEIIALLRGVNSETGEVIPEMLSFRTPRILEALQSSADALEALARREERHSSLPERTSAPWNAGEDRMLLVAYEKKVPIARIADNHRRTIGAIRSRLSKLTVLKTQ